MSAQPQSQSSHPEGVLRGHVVVNGVEHPLYVDPWEQLPTEPDRWFDRFVEFARPLGYDFTVDRAVGMWRRKMISLGIDPAEDSMEGAWLIWKTMAATWLWAKRAEMWAREQSRQSVSKWAQRRREMIEEDWSQGSALRALANEMIDLLPKFIVEGLKEIDGQQVFAVRLNTTPDQLARALTAAAALQRDAVDAGEALDRLGALQNASRKTGATTVAEALQGVLSQPGSAASGADDGPTLADELAANIARRALDGDNAALRELRQFVQGDTLNVATDYTKLLEQLGLTIDDVRRTDPTLAALLDSKRQGSLPTTAAAATGYQGPLAAGADELSQSGDGQDLPTAP